MIQKYAKAVNVVNTVFTYIAGILVLLMILIIVQDVIRRYVFGDPTSWSLDVARFMLVYVFFLVLGPALASGHHVSVDLFINKSNHQVKKIMKIVVYTITMIFGILLFWQLATSTWEVFATNRLFPTTISIPMKYVYFITPIGTLQFILTAICEILQALSLTKTNSPKNQEDHLAKTVQG